MALPLSLNTNVPALEALRQLSGTNQNLQETQERISSGKIVRSAEDNAATFAISRNLKADFQSFNAVGQSLDRATSALDVAITSAESIQDILIDMKEKVVAASDQGLDSQSRTSIALDFEKLRDQITTIVRNAEFNGTNLIDNGTDFISAIVSTDAQDTIQVSHQTLALNPSATLSTSDQIRFTAGASFATATEAQGLISAVDASIENLSEVLTEFGSTASTIERQNQLTQEIQDTIEVGIGNLVDANMARESARLQALQVQQQLGTQALSIANQTPQIILSLFG
ncbi:flagellin [Rhodothalassium salexigens DSM 2132]|uniref:Flagellin n=1 Tax=Rhodothalassium salexigens DSM 2132 TaxID=1188247 RepID=A0A4V2SN77_RHOSA|nr:flagellin [Rhodothalassium salexigens]MBB4212751.1 flagellin [Rhodothalassium salexigens DSM 2132]TCP30146.1 flagellin [Rhodothalassium salexigens DSM 2132]